MKENKWKRIAALCTAAVVSAGMFIPSLSVSALGEGQRLWDFEDGTQGWVYDDSWKGDAQVTGSAECPGNRKCRV